MCNLRYIFYYTVNVCVCVCMYVYVYTCIYVYIYILISNYIYIYIYCTFYINGNYEKTVSDTLCKFIGVGNFNNGNYYLLL